MYGFGRLSADVAASHDRPAPPCFASGALPRKVSAPAAAVGATTGRPPTFEFDIRLKQAQNVRSTHTVGTGVPDGPKQWGMLALPDTDRFILPIQNGPSRTPVPTACPNIGSIIAAHRRWGISFATAHRTRSRAVLNYHVTPQRTHLNAQSRTFRRPTDLNPPFCESFAGSRGLFQKPPERGSGQRPENNRFPRSPRLNCFQACLSARLRL